MTRKEFIQICSILGVGLPLGLSASSCSDEDILVSGFKGKVVIIGAGAGGLSAGYLLQQLGIEFQIIEASATFGGRMKINNSFADFPLPMGAEWLETSVSVFKEIVNNSGVSVDIKTFDDSPDLKFVNSSWFNFYEQYIVPSIANKIVYNNVVKKIDYSSDKVVITANDGVFEADKVIVSVPLKILQLGEIEFNPLLPKEKQDAINSVTIWDGFKAFFEFSSKFYDDEYEFKITPETDGQKIYYNAALGQNSTKHILGLFAVGKPAFDFLSMSENELKDYVLGELDAIYSKKATPGYIKHVFQNWNNEPYIKGGYLSDYADWKSVKVLGQSVANKLYFAGGAYTDGEDWVSVHLAAASARIAVKEL